MNIITWFFGGMGGCAMIGQTMINVKASNARTRNSTFLVGVFLLILVVTLGDIDDLIPMPALVAVMIFVAIATFDWNSIKPSTLRMMPKSETPVILITVIFTVWIQSLAIGMGVGVLTAIALFANRVAHLVTVERRVKEHFGVKISEYGVNLELFFAFSNDRYTQFDDVEDLDRVVIDMHASHLWDTSTIAALDAITEGCKQHGKHVEIIVLNTASLKLRERMGGKLGGGH